MKKKQTKQQLQALCPVEYVSPAKEQIMKNLSEAKAIYDQPPLEVKRSFAEKRQSSRKA